MMNPINKHTMLKSVRTHSVWFGYMAACNVNSFHITGGWHLGHDVIVTIDRNGDYYIVSTRSTQGYEKLNDYIRSFLFYNGGSELGKRVRFWKEEK